LLVFVLVSNSGQDIINYKLYLRQKYEKLREKGNEIAVKWYLPDWF